MVQATPAAAVPPIQIFVVARRGSQVFLTFQPGELLYWRPIHGHPQQNEALEAAAGRLMRDQTGAAIGPQALDHTGTLNAYRGDRDTPIARLEIFTVRINGDVRPPAGTTWKWHEVHELRRDHFWIGDHAWLHATLRDHRFKGYFVLTADGTGILELSLTATFHPL